jgi:hypothetical protein
LTVGSVAEDEPPVRLIPTALAILVVALFGTALYLMSTEEFAAAGASFLSASLVIYLRARWMQRGGERSNVGG